MVYDNVEISKINVKEDNSWCVGFFNQRKHANYWNAGIRINCFKAL
jgi:hypothetical protein